MVTHAHINPRQQTTAFRRTEDYASWTDSQLIVACQHHEPIAFECLRKRYLCLVGCILRHLAPELNDTDDLMQEVFIRVWNSIHGLRDPLAFRAWLNQIVSNCFFDELRRRTKRPLLYIDCPLNTEEGHNSAFTQIRDHGAQPDEIAESRELAQDIESGLVHLAPFARAALMMRFEGLPYAEIARLTKTEVGTVKSRISRAREKLRANVLQHEDRRMSAHAIAV